jgi:hypothetical protein
MADREFQRRLAAFRAADVARFPSEAFLREHAVKLEASMLIMNERGLPEDGYEPKWLIPKEN